MTRPLSDAQLDAEAAAPVLPLYDRIDVLREDYRTEAAFSRMTSSAPPITRHVTEYAPGRFDVDLEEEPADGNGRNLSGAMVGLIGSIIGRHDRDACAECQSSSKLHEQETSYGPRHPVRHALLLWERKCRRHHRDWPDHRGRAVCADIAWSVIRDETSIEWIADQLDVSFDRGERLLQGAVDFMDRIIERSDQPNDLTHDRETCPVCRASDSRAS